MWQRYILGLAVVLTACGSNASATGDDAVAEVDSQSDSSGTDAMADIGTDTASSTDAVSDTIVQEVDAAQCLPFMADCKTNDQCCAPNSCINITGAPKCQTEGPQQDIVISDLPDVSADISPDIAPDAGDITANDVGINCSGNGGYSFQDLQYAYKNCQTDNDCFPAFHQINCCGSFIAYGLNKSAKDVFQSYESQCEGQYPKCGCAAYATQAEDGFSSFNQDDFIAGCIAGTCHTLIKAAKTDCTSAVLQSPKPFKWCGNAGDCDFSSHQVDCCGSLVFTGIAKVAKGAFDAAEKACVGGGALCDCMPKPTTLDDGQTLTTSAVPVQCVNGTCLTGKY